MTDTDERDISYMREALLLADKAAGAGEVPVGAVLVQDDQIIGYGFNRPVSAHDASAHAEIVAIRNAGGALKNYRLPNSTLYVTIEPCTMCLGALIHARVKRLVFGATEPRAGAVSSQLKLLENDFFNHQIEWQGGVLAEECGNKLSEFFRHRRAK